MPTPSEVQSLDLSQNIRDDITNLDDDALRASLKEFGWKQHLPAFVDENNVVLVGHRRMRIAAELGIEPHVVKLAIGTGTAAEYERKVIAVTANIGFAEMSVASRRKLAVEFCQQGMTQAATAAMLGVNQSTIARDLETLCTPHKVHDRVDRLGRKNTGRPKGSGTKASKPKADTKPADKLRAETAPPPQQPAKPKVAANGARATAAPPPSSQEIDRQRLKLEYEYEVRARKLENEYIARMAKQARDSVTVQISGDVQTEVNRWLELLLPELHKERARARMAIAKRKRVVTKAAFNKLMFAVHPDTGGHATAKDRDAATRTLNALKPYVLDEADEPTQWESDLPDNLAGWAKRLQDAELKRRMRDIPTPRGMPLPPFLEPRVTAPPERDAAKANRDAAKPTTH